MNGNKYNSNTFIDDEKESSNDTDLIVCVF